MQATGIRDTATILMKLAYYAKSMTTTTIHQGGILESPSKQGSGLVQVLIVLYYSDTMTQFLGRFMIQFMVKV